MENELLYRLALTRVQGIGPMRYEATDPPFRRSQRHIPLPRREPWKRSAGSARPGPGRSKVFKSTRRRRKNWPSWKNIRYNHLFFTDPAYPTRLLKHRNAPALLFYKGTADLNAPKILAVVGTRKPTEYGKQVTEKIIGSLALPDLVIISGLAYGIDAAAHKSALRHGLSTIGVLGHGLDRIYPQQHAGLARNMLKAGGLLTGFVTGTEPEEHNFPVRNRIIAALCDALIVVETGTRGGSTLTVDDAIACRRKVFALPGRMTDGKSAGCNALICQGKARLLTGTQQLLQEMRWDGHAVPASYNPGEFNFSMPRYPLPPRPKSRRSARPFHGSHPGAHIRSSPAPGPASSPPVPAAWKCSETQLSALALSTQENDSSSIFCAKRAVSPWISLLARDDLGGNKVSLTLLTLELQGLIGSLPGKRYIPV